MPTGWLIRQAELPGFDGDAAFGIACLRRIGSGTAEIKRMCVQPSHRGGGFGRALFDRLIELATVDRYERIRLDSPDFMTAAHALYRSGGFTDIEPDPESEIPDAYKSHWHSWSASSVLRLRVVALLGHFLACQEVRRGSIGRTIPTA